MNLKQLSELLGLSQTTVSRALNGYPEVSKATRDRVLRVAEQQNYLPNKRATALATGKAMAIGHVIPVFSKNDVVNPIFAEFVAGASQTYSQHGYELVLTIANQKDEEAIYRNLTAKRAVDGVIVHSPLRDDPRIELLSTIGLPFVVHGRSTGCKIPYSWLDMNNQSAFRQATKLLLDLGHRRIVLLNGVESLNFAWLRRQGYSEALLEHGISIDENLMCSAELTEHYGFISAKELLAQPNAPTAFLVSSYVVALGVRRAISDLRLNIGKDISVIIHDDELSYFDNGGDEPQFTATRSSVREAGVLAAQMLIDIVSNNTPEPQSRLLQAHLTIGQSTGPINS